MKYKELNKNQKDRMKQISVHDYIMEWENPEFMDYLLGSLPQIRGMKDDESITDELSELNNIAVAYKEDWFDNTVIKYFALEKRDTGLLLQLMQNNLFNREEALVYTYDLDVFNSYLMLKSYVLIDKELNFEYLK